MNSLTDNDSQFNNKIKAVAGTVLLTLPATTPMIILAEQYVAPQTAYATSDQIWDESDIIPGMYGPAERVNTDDTKEFCDKVLTPIGIGIVVGGCAAAGILHKKRNRKTSEDKESPLNDEDATEDNNPINPSKSDANDS